MKYLKFLSTVKGQADARVLTNLMEVTNQVGINHNASTALIELGLVKKRKTGTYKWVAKDPNKKLADRVQLMANVITKRNNY